MLSGNMLIEAMVIASGLFSLLSLGVACVCIMKMRSQARQMTKLGQRLENKLQVVNSGSVGLGKRLLVLEQKLQQSDMPAQVSPRKLPDSVGSSEQASRDSDLSDAISLLDAGLQPDEVARRCGISKAEASLIKLMSAHAAGSHAA